MKNTLILAVAALSLLSGGADAGTKMSVISLGGKFCVKANVNVTDGVSVTANESDSCQTYIGEGFVGKVKGFGKVAVVGGQSSQYPGYELTITLQYPFKTGGSYAVYDTSDGVTMNELGSGTYTVE